MTDTTQTRRQRTIMKTLAIIGLLGILIAAGWAAVQVVNYGPQGFEQLASLASRVQPSTKPVLFSVIGEPRTIESGQTSTLTWSAANRPGSYVFRYTCADGVALAASNPDGTRNLSCETDYNLGNVTAFTIQVESEKAAYTDVFYTLSFIPSRSAEVQAVAQSSLLIVNQTRLGMVTDPVTPETEVETVTPDPVAPPTTEPITPPTATSTESMSTSSPTITRPAPQPQYIYAIPVSNPLGETDLAARFLNTGTISRNTFIVGALTRNQTGAVQFEIRNLGTKTSERWTYTITAPGLTFTSESQAPLKPSERAVLTIEFPGSNLSQERITVRVTTTNDRNQNNDQFIQPITQR